MYNGDGESYRSTFYAACFKVGLLSLGENSKGFRECTLWTRLPPTPWLGYSKQQAARPATGWDHNPHNNSRNIFLPYYFIVEEVLLVGQHCRAIVFFRCGCSSSPRGKTVMLTIMLETGASTATCHVNSCAKRALCLPAVPAGWRLLMTDGQKWIVMSCYCCMLHREGKGKPDKPVWLLSNQGWVLFVLQWWVSLICLPPCLTSDMLNISYCESAWTLIGFQRFYHFINCYESETIDTVSQCRYHYRCSVDSTIHLSWSDF